MACMGRPRFNMTCGGARGARGRLGGPGFGQGGEQPPVYAGESGQGRGEQQAAELRTATAAAAGAGARARRAAHPRQRSAARHPRPGLRAPGPGLEVGPRLPGHQPPQAPGRGLRGGVLAVPARPICPPRVSTPRARPMLGPPPRSVPPHRSRPPQTPCHRSSCTPLRLGALWQRALQGGAAAATPALPRHRPARRSSGRRGAGAGRAAGGAPARVAIPAPRGRAHPFPVPATSHGAAPRPLMLGLRSLRGPPGLVRLSALTGGCFRRSHRDCGAAHFPPRQPAAAGAMAGVREQITLTQEEQQLFSLLLEAAKAAGTGTTLRCAGGWVRDKLLGKDSKDIDVALDNMLGREFAEKVRAAAAALGAARRGIARWRAGAAGQEGAAALGGGTGPAHASDSARGAAHCCARATLYTPQPPHPSPPKGERVPAISGPRGGQGRGDPLQPGAVEAPGNGAHEGQRPVDRPGQPAQRELCRGQPHTHHGVRHAAAGRGAQARGARGARAARRGRPTAAAAGRQPAGGSRGRRPDRRATTTANAPPHPQRLHHQRAVLQPQRRRGGGPHGQGPR
jgi:hypothetical protein